MKRKRIENKKKNSEKCMKMYEVNWLFSESREWLCDCISCAVLMCVCVCVFWIAFSLSPVQCIRCMADDEKCRTNTPIAMEYELAFCAHNRPLNYVIYS